MAVSPKLKPLHHLLAAVLAVVALFGCSPKPDLRVSGREPPTGSIALGKQLLHQGRAMEAVSVFRRQLRQEGPEVQSLNGLAIAYSELGRPDLAADMFARALALSPDDPATLNNVGFSALRRADAELARLYLEKARARDDGLGEIEGNLARLALLEEIELKQVARPSFRQATVPEERRLHRLTIPTLQQPPPSAVWRAGPPELSLSTMIDFTAVSDPFFDRQTVE